MVASSGWIWAPLFTAYEFHCPCCRQVEVDTRFMARLVWLREAYDRPIRIVPGGGYRCKNHPAERPRVVEKGRGGAHTFGRAFDPDIPIRDTLVFLRIAQDVGFTRVGLKLTNERRQMHVDDMTAADGFPVREDGMLCWSY